MSGQNKAADNAKPKSAEPGKAVDSQGLDPGPIEIGIVMKNIGQDEEMPVDMHLKLHAPSPENDDEDTGWSEK